MAVAAAAAAVRVVGAIARGGSSSCRQRRLQEGVDELEASLLRCDESLFVLTELKRPLVDP